MDGSKPEALYIDHVQLAMPAGGEAQARAFYEVLLGIPEVAKPPDLAKRGGCWFERGQLKVHLGVTNDFVAAKKAHPAFAVSDLGALCQLLADAGYVLKADAPIAGYERMFVDDPFGNRIELLSPSGRSP